MNRFRSGFTVLGHIMLVLSIISFVILLAFYGIIALFCIIPDILFISLIYGLGSAHTKINVLSDLLQKKDIIRSDDVSQYYQDEDNVEEVYDLFETNDNYNEENYFCDNCGNQVSLKNKKCKHCGEPIKIEQYDPMLFNNTNSNIYVCKNCHTPVFEDETCCKNCGNPKENNNK